MVEEFGLYLGRDKKKCQPLDIPNYYIGWVKGIGIIFQGKQYLPDFILSIGGPSLYLRIDGK